MSGMLDPYFEYINGPCYRWAFFLHGLGSLAPLQVRVNANQYKLIIQSERYIGVGYLASCQHQIGENRLNITENRAFKVG
jgi:hypothetical protein